MAEQHFPNDLPTENWEQVRQAIVRFEDAWDSGRPVSVADFLTAEEADHSTVLRALVRVDLERRIAVDEGARVESYLTDHPELGDDEPFLLELITREYLVRRRCGQDVQRDEFERRFPQFGQRLASHLIERFGEQSTLGFIEGAVAESTDTELQETSPAHRAKENAPKIAGYEILDRVSQGGMGVVYKARHRVLNRLVALKLPHPELAADEAGRERFLREARAAARLTHPNVCPIHEVGDGDGRPYIAMAFIHGTTLRQRADDQLSARAMAQIMAKLVDAVAYAHERGVLHRDIKPSNVLIDEESDEPILTDFGLAKELGRSDSQMTRTGEVMGTPAYMSPEQAAGATNRIGPPSDIYSLGAVLYALLTGRPPFHADNVLETLKQVLEQEPVAPRQLNHTANRDLETICLKCLEKEPTKRYATAQDLADELGRFLSGRPILARPVGRIERASRWCRRNPLAATVIALLIALAIGGPAVAINQYQLQKEADQSAKRSNRLFNKERETSGKLAESLANETKALKSQQRELALSYLQRGAEQLDRGYRISGMHFLLLGYETAADHREIRNSALNLIAGWAPAIGHALPHDDSVHTLTFSPDGKWMATGTLSGTARVWDLASRSPVGKPMKHDEMVHIERFSPDGATLITQAGGQLSFWNVVTGEPARESIDSHAASFDGRTVLQRGSLLVDTLTGEPRGPAIKHPPHSRGEFFSPDSSVLMTFGGTTVRFWDTQTAEQRKFVIDLGKPVTHAWFCDEGRYVYTTTEDHEVRFWKWEVGETIGKPLPHDAFVAFAAISPDGKTAFTANSGGSGQLWDLLAGTRRGRMVLHEKRMSWARFTTDGKKLITTSHDRTVRLWHSSDGRPVCDPLRHEDLVHYAEVTPDRESLVSISSDRTARIWSLAAMRPRRTLDGLMDGVSSLAFSRDGHRMIAGGEFGTLRVWDGAAGDSPPQETTVAGGGDTDGTLARVFAVSLAGDGRTALVAATTAMEGLTARRYQIAGGTLLHSVRLGAASESVAFSPDGKLVAVASEKAVRLVDVATGAQVGEALHPGGFMHALAFNRDGTLVATGTAHSRMLRGGQARVWNVATRQAVGQPLEHAWGVAALAFSHDSQTLLTGSMDYTARLWNIDSGQARTEPLRHEDVVYAVAFSPDNRFALTVSMDTTARLWDVATGLPCGLSMRHDGPCASASFTPDGKYIAVGTGKDPGSHRVAIWKTPAAIDLRDGGIRTWVESTTAHRRDKRGVVAPLSVDEWLRLSMASEPTSQ